MNIPRFDRHTAEKCIHNNIKGYIVHQYTKYGKKDYELISSHFIPLNEFGEYIYYLSENGYGIKFLSSWDE